MKTNLIRTTLVVRCTRRWVFAFLSQPRGLGNRLSDIFLFQVGIGGEYEPYDTELFDESPRQLQVMRRAFMANEQHPLASSADLSRIDFALQPSLRGPNREVRAVMIELERLLHHMAPDDIERLLDFARRLSR